MNADALEPGSVIDGFRVEEKLHQGGMAAIWRVSRTDIGFPLAMKVPRLTHGDDPAAVVGFEVEQMILPLLSGSHVPRFIANGDLSVLPYIVMELIPGDSLRARLSGAPLAPAEVAGIGVKVATALHDLHRQHVIHLDIKPSSVLFRPGGDAVLIDFGLAHHGYLPDLLAEEFHIPMGTGPYISPEQVLRVRNEPRSDLFALGVTLYHLVTGERPFGNPAGAHALRRRLYRDPIPPRALRPDCPAWLQEIILRCLEVDPTRRYNTAGHVAFDLQHPQQVVLTGRASRVRRDGPGAVARRWFRSLGAVPAVKRPVAEHLSRAPIVMIAVDVSSDMQALDGALRDAARRVLRTEPGARLACVTVLQTARMGIEAHADEHRQNLHVQRLIELQHWARPLRGDARQITFHVLEEHSPAAALITYARSNHVDHIVMGARASSTLRRFLGSVSSQVVAEAPCTVTVVRLPSGGEALREPATTPPAPGA